MSHHLLKLSPTDVLFFRDGRPMEGSSAGKGAAWPLPHVINAAIYHAMRRAGLPNLHKHRAARNGVVFSEDRKSKGREFGSLKSAGPFPVINQQWLFPRPCDAENQRSTVTTLHPLLNKIEGTQSSLNRQMHAVVNQQAPSKHKAEPWLTADAYAAYLKGEDFTENTNFYPDDALYLAEHNIGIGIDHDTDTQDGERFYSASYLRLKPGVQMGIIGHCMDKGHDGQTALFDLIKSTFPQSDNQTHILAGGQQRTCTVERTTTSILPMPIGTEISGTRVRWTLLTPAIFPQINSSEKNSEEHPGGSLPTWVNPQTMHVQLKDPAQSQRRAESRSDWRRRVANLPTIKAKLVACLIPRAIPVTGWALSDSDDEGNFTLGGARATHLAVPAGAVYYFEAIDEENAKMLAQVLNWHGSSDGSEIQNRRSSLMGEKGFGLGVCSNWTPHQIS